MPEEVNQAEEVKVEETEEEKERKQVASEIQAILDKYGYGLSVAGFTVVKIK